MMIDMDFWPSPRPVAKVCQEPADLLRLASALVHEARLLSDSNETRAWVELADEHIVSAIQAEEGSR